MTAVLMIIIFTITFGLMFFESRHVVEEKALGKTAQILESTALYTENILQKAEVAANNMRHVVEQHLDKPDNMFLYSRQILQDNPNLLGCSISFEPYYFKEKGKYFSAYSINEGDTIRTEQEGMDSYQYFTLDWYTIPKERNKPYWTDPFKDYATEGIIVEDIFASYSQPFYDSHHQIIGTISVDIKLDWFSSTISKIKPYPHSYCIMLDRKGNYLVHPDSTQLFYKDIFTSAEQRNDKDLAMLGHEMLDGRNGHKHMTLNGEDCYIFFKPFKKTGWSLAVVCPERDILAPYYRQGIYAQIITTVGVLCLLLFSWIIIQKSFKPLNLLASSARSIADGNFDQVIADTQRDDEIGQLQRSFKTMQQSLATNINKVQQETQTLEQRNAELQEAYQHAQEDEQLKTAVLHYMTNQTTIPVQDIANTSQTLCEQYDQMNDEDIKKTVFDLMEHAGEVTHMLDEMLHAAQQDSQQATSENVQPNTLPS